MKREETINVLCYGDSNTYGYDPTDGLRYTSEVRWTGLLQHLLGGGYHIIEEGCKGRTVSVKPEDEPWKFGYSSLKAILNTHKPIDVFVMMLGTNDLKRGFHATPESVSEGVRRTMLTTASFLEEKQGFCPIGVLIVPPEISEGIAHSPFSRSFDADVAPGQSRQLPLLYSKVADDLNSAGIMQCTLLNSQQIIQPSEADCLHLMPEAHRALAEALTKIIPDLSFPGQTPDQ
jgi:lysophospholipase L1-like esterase